REKTVKATLRFLHRRRRLEENKVEIKEAENGYIVTCRILDKTDDLLSMQMLVPNMAHAELVKKQFLNDPILLYTGVLNILTDNLSALRNIKPSPNNDLF
ncbi:MAG: DUF4364 family protein, partial [Oscillospiraceae bacterium]|nr:DUF4364 family protein [Oscillospiraceae bacterium]